MSFASIIMYYEYFAINVCVHMLVLFLHCAHTKQTRKLSFRRCIAMYRANEPLPV